MRMFAAREHRRGLGAAQHPAPALGVPRPVPLTCCAKANCKREPDRRTCRRPRAASGCPRRSMPTRWRGCSSSAATTASACATRRSWSCCIRPGCACRNSLGLDLLDLDLRDRTVRVRRQGQQDAHRAGGPAGARGAAALARRAGDPRRQSARQAVFVGVNGGRLGPRIVQRRIARWARLQGLPRTRASAHVPAFVRVAPARILAGPARRAGTAGPRQHQHDPGLHAP